MVFNEKLSFANEIVSLKISEYESELEFPPGPEPYFIGRREGENGNLCSARMV